MLIDWQIVRAVMRDFRAGWLLTQEINNSLRFCYEGDPVRFNYKGANWFDDYFCVCNIWVA
jgi:hypothetical protein